MMNNNAKCPHCHKGLMIVPAASTPRQPGDGWRPMVNMQQSTPAALSAAPGVDTGSDWQRVTPVARLEPKDITTAVYDAGVSFGLVTLAGLGLCWYFDVTYWLAPAGGMAVAVWRYFGGLALAKGLLEVVETITHRDIDGDGHIGRPEPQRVRVEIKTDNGNSQQWQFADLNIEPPKLRALAQTIINGHSFSERTATGLGKMAFTQDEFRTLRNELLERGLAEWNHPTRKQQGVSLTRGGRSLIRAVLATPLPRAGERPADNVHRPHAAARSTEGASGNYQFMEGQ